MTQHDLAVARSNYEAISDADTRRLPVCSSSRDNLVSSSSSRGLRRIEAARAEGVKLTVLSATVLEVVYILESAQARYGWNRQDIAGAVTAIANEPASDVKHGEPLAEAASVYGSRSIDLHDCLLAVIAGRGGTRVLSFDRDLRKLDVAEQP